MGPLTPAITALLPRWVARQRWYAGKGRVPVLRRIGGLRLDDPAGEVDMDVHLLVDESGQTPTTYQVPLTSRGARLAGGEQALVATVDQASLGTRYIYDAPHDPVFAAALLRLMLDEGTAASHGKQGGAVAGGHRLTTADPGQLLASHVLSGEQSNTSIILDLVDALGAASNPLICKLFRVLHHGQNPDVVVQSTLAQAGSTRVPRAVGYVSGQWPDTGAPHGVARGHLAFVQEFLPGVQDAWRVALAAVASGADFSSQAHSLGQATAQVHSTLARAMGTRDATFMYLLGTRGHPVTHAAVLAATMGYSAIAVGLFAIVGVPVMTRELSRSAGGRAPRPAPATSDTPPG